ncbi:MAG: glycerol-3-phosphate 1-O-acyltransferase PlsY [Rhodospirillales bacterium]|nr:glycerol-3-phosphate 1-O-acyltransferase PlsY [Rhodospirillales bacterium]MBO6785974.1 glycerol-3-phosphate 1-O-acyltransferase PlsY [Rhodospirillales bacterium]
MENLDPNMLAAIAAVCGYLLGSVPWGLVLTKMAGLGDIREIGSGNIGATNVLRTGNKFLAFLTLILDASKGAVAALIFMQFSELAGLIAAFAAVLGHNFPVWLKFKGGKGVATTLGALLMVSWPVGVLTCCVWLVVASTFKYSSLASISSVIAAPLIAWKIFGNEDVALMAIGLAVLSVIRHKDNIRRLIKGEESKIGQKKAEQKDDAEEAKPSA